MWVHEFGSAISQGAALPRWVQGANGGLGDPAFAFLHPGFYYCAAALLMAGGLSVKNAVLGVLLISNLSLGVVSYWQLLRFAEWPTALAGAVLIQLAPSLAGLGLMYGAFPWYSSTLGVALTIFSTARLLEDPSLRRVPLVAFGVFIATIFHVLSGFMVLLCCGAGLVVLTLCLGRLQKSLRLMGLWGTGALLGLGLSSFYIFPALLLQEYVTPSEWFIPGTIDWRNSFLFPVISARIFGTYWNAFQYFFPGVSAAILIICIAKIYLARTPIAFGAQFFLVCAVFAIFFGGELSYPLWESSDALRNIQRGFRFQIILAITSIAFLISGVTSKLQWRSLSFNIIPLLLAFLLVIGSTMAVSAKIALADGVKVVDALSFEKNARGPLEYATRNRGPEWKNYLAQGGLDGYCAKTNILCKVLANSSHSFVVSVHVPSSVTLVLPRFEFPFWQVSVDDRAVPQRYDIATGLISVVLMAGPHTVRIEYKRTLVEWMGLLVSALSLIVFGLLLAYRKERCMFSMVCQQVNNDTS